MKIVRDLGDIINKQSVADHFHHCLIVSGELLEEKNIAHEQL